jgi:adenylyltransferase/sulfurtransferase
MRFRELKLERDPACPVCGEHPTLHELIDYEEFCGLTNAKGETPVQALTALELKARLDRGDRIQLIDIREPHERAIVKFPGAAVIPLGQMVRRMEELDPTADAVFLCKIGQRSIFAIRALQNAGYTGGLYNLQDGVNAWARDVDQSLPQY